MNLQRITFAWRGKRKPPEPLLKCSCCPVHFPTTDGFVDTDADPSKPAVLYCEPCGLALLEEIQIL